MEILITLIIMGLFLWGLWTMGNDTDKLIKSW